jgi:hypothetical protein
MPFVGRETQTAQHAETTPGVPASARSPTVPAYLEASSERNAALYERLGFQCAEVLRFAGSPPLRLMLRPPQPWPRAT